MINLLGNAVKFTARGQVLLRVRYPREMAVVDIEDAGPGLSKQKHERIFEPFTRANTGGATGPGVGLGLTIAKMLTDLMGGELTLTSTPGVGSVFRVKLLLPEVYGVPGRSLGYYRGIMNKLDEIELGQPEVAAFVVEMRGLARQFQFEAMGLRLNRVAHDI